MCREAGTTQPAGVDIARIGAFGRAARGRRSAVTQLRPNSGGHFTQVLKIGASRKSPILSNPR